VITIELVNIWFNFVLFLPIIYTFENCRPKLKNKTNIPEVVITRVNIPCASGPNCLAMIIVLSRPTARVIT
jgi:hypothetical protein